jgi:hypothetical protein
MTETTTLFEQLELALETENYDKASTIFAKLSVYLGTFTDELLECYEYAEALLQNYQEDEDDSYFYDEPSEYDEWLDFDPDC